MKFERTKKCIAWAAQQGYIFAEEAAKEIEEITNEKLVEDQPYYSSYKWVKKD